MRTQILLISALLLGMFTQAQNYTFTLLQNSDYNYTVAAVADFNSGTDTPNLESFGFTIMLEDGASIDEGTMVFDHLSLDSVTITTAAQLDAADPGMDRSASLVVSPSGVSMFPAHTIGQVINLVTFDVLGSPTTGEISILDNGSALAGAAAGQFDSFLVIDETGGTSPTNLFSGLTAPSSHGFSTLGLETEELLEISVYPNPATDYVTISSKGSIEANLVKIYDLNGRLVKQAHLEKMSAKTTINISELSTANYLMLISGPQGQVTKQLIKK